MGDVCNVVFYEPAHTGHHFAYLARMLPGFLELPLEISIATTSHALKSEEFAKTLAPFAEQLKLIDCCAPLPQSTPFKNARHRFREVKQIIVRELRPDHLIICYGDGFWQIAHLSAAVGNRGWPKELNVEAWLYRGGFADPSDRRLRTRLTRRWFKGLMRRGLFAKLNLDDELLFDFAAPLAESSQTQIMLTPNPIVLMPKMARETAKKVFDVPPDGKLLSLSGMIDERKGALGLLNAFRFVVERHKEINWRLLLAGPHHQEIHRVLSSLPFSRWMEEQKIVSVDRYLNENEMFACAAASDLVTAPYPNHSGRSSIILWAAAAGRPCLGTDAGCIGHVISQQRLGWTCDVNDPQAFAEGLTQALQSPWTDDDSDRVRKYAEFHSVENYQRYASQLVRERIAKQAD